MAKYVEALRNAAQGEEGNSMPSSADMSGLILVIFGIWSVVGLAYYVWYLWSLSRLFPKIGLPASHGWIPVWNQWQLINRGGYPGWIVLLVLVPVVGAVVVLVVTILAISRINSEFGKGGGFTALGVLIPPVWAMMLANHIDAMGFGTVQPAAGRPPAGVQAPAAYAPPVQSAQSVPAAPVLPVVPLDAAAPVVPAAPYSMEQELPPVPQDLFAEPAQPAPPAPQPAPPTPQPADLSPVPPPGAPVPGGWSLGRTTEAEYERLASEPVAPVAPGLAPGQSQRPFSWPEEQGPGEAAEPIAPYAAPEPVAVPVTPAAVEPTPPAAPEPEEEEDRTIVVAKQARWVLEVPEGSLHELTGDDIVVGRKPAAPAGVASLGIPDPTRTVSKTHARLRRRGDGWTVEDLHSTNGIATGDGHGTSQQIEPGTEVQATEQMIFGTLVVTLRRLD